jgi:hypothetical protein
MLKQLVREHSNKASELKQNKRTTIEEYQKWMEYPLTQYLYASIGREYYKALGNLGQQNEFFLSKIEDILDVKKHMIRKTATEMQEKHDE